MLKTALKRGAILAAIIVIVAFIPGLGEYLLKFLVPPRLYWVLGGVALILLYLILVELRKRNGGDKE